MKPLIARITVFLFTLLLILALTACGEKTDANTTADATVSAATEAAAADTTEAVKTDETSADSTIDSSLVGSWDYAEISGFVYTFNADGTGTYDVAGEIMSFTYKADGSTLMILYTDSGVDEPMELKYTIDGDTLTIKDSFGADTVYKRK